MLSFLVDNLRLVGADRSAPLAQGNQPPVAVDDTLTVELASPPVNIAVLANDIDPEGLPLTLVSAFAALGTAVAETDNTVTYTPPTDTPPGVVEFDTVVYEIEDVNGERDTGQINITIIEPTVSVTTVPGNTLVVSAGASPMDITITEPAVFAGTYSADIADLATGPVNLAPPTISGTPEAGEVLTAGDGLWILDTEAGTPARTLQWQRGAVDIPGQTSASYTVQVGDTVSGVRIVETLSDANGSRSAASPAVGAFLPIDDTGLIGWWDADDTASITEVGGAVSAWASQNGAATLTQTAGARQPITGVRSLNGRNVLDFDGGDFLDQTIALPASGDVAFHMVLAIDSTASAFEAVLAVDAGNDFQIDANNTAQFDGRLNASGIAAATPLDGGPFLGATVLSVVCDFTGTGTIEVFLGGVSRGTAAYTTPIDSTVALHIMTNRSRNAWVNGAVAELAISASIANRSDYHAYLAAKWGVA